MEVVKRFVPSGTYSTIQFNSQVQQIKNLSAQIGRYKRICSIVRSSIQNFASDIYYAYRFGKNVTNIIEYYRNKTSQEIVQHFPNLNASFEVINNQISSTNSRDWSSVASECRNIFIYLSGALWISPDTEYKCKDGDLIKLSSEKNKLIAYVDCKIGASNEMRAKAKKNVGYYSRSLYTRR